MDSILIYQAANDLVQNTGTRNIKRIARSCSLDILETPRFKDVLGFLSLHFDKPLILINSHLDSQTKQMVCGYALGHYLEHLVPVLDESGNMLLREEFYLDGLNCNPETFDLECELLNQQYHKNNTYDEIKSHHYIISHDPRDNADHDLTGERAQAIGLEYAKANFPGHQALVCTHTDPKAALPRWKVPDHERPPG